MNIFDKIHVRLDNYNPWNRGCIRFGVIEYDEQARRESELYHLIEEDRLFQEKWGREQRRAAGLPCK